MQTKRKKNSKLYLVTKLSTHIKPIRSFSFVYTMINKPDKNQERKKEKR